MVSWNILCWKGPTRMVGPHSWSQYIAAHLAHRIFLCSVLNAKMTFQILESHKPLLISREISHFQAIPLCRPSGDEVTLGLRVRNESTERRTQSQLSFVPTKGDKREAPSPCLEQRPAASPQWQRR